MEVPPCPMKTSLFSLEMVENYHFLEAHAGAQKMVKGLWSSVQHTQPSSSPKFSKAI